MHYSNLLLRRAALGPQERVTCAGSAPISVLELGTGRPVRSDVGDSGHAWTNRAPSESRIVRMLNTGDAVAAYRGLGERWPTIPRQVQHASKTATEMIYAPDKESAGRSCQSARDEHFFSRSCGMVSGKKHRPARLGLQIHASVARESAGKTQNEKPRSGFRIFVKRLGAVHLRDLGPSGHQLDKQTRQTGRQAGGAQAGGQDTILTPWWIAWEEPIRGNLLVRHDAREPQNFEKFSMDLHRTHDVRIWREIAVKRLELEQIWTSTFGGTLRPLPVQVVS
ncbi:hypothetical protein BJV78DRAFT_1155565 [Lactifluus subvellereus]|nr:hypothetical protein BJV78DRAFT_1155565 [Lactifluus subvellereus]